VQDRTIIHGGMFYRTRRARITHLLRVEENWPCRMQSRC
jgi:hypothetical protein